MPKDRRLEMLLQKYLYVCVDDDADSDHRPDIVVRKSQAIVKSVSSLIYFANYKFNSILQ